MQEETILRYAGLIHGLQRGYVFDPLYRRMIRTEVQTGRREHPPAWLVTFPNAYFHHPGAPSRRLTSPTNSDRIRLCA